MTIQISDCDDDRFQDAIMNNRPLDNFDTSNVTNMSGMFYDAASFNQPLDNFDTSKVTNMHSMFNGAESFNQPLDNFDTSRVTDMSRMFANATNFNQPLDTFDMTKVERLDLMFIGATSMYIGYIMRFSARAIFVYKKSKVISNILKNFHKFTSKGCWDIYIYDMNSLRQIKANKLKIQSAIDGFIIDCF